MSLLSGTQEEGEQQMETEGTRVKGNLTDEETCPLFMDGLPSDFSSNPGLAALASLLYEETAKELPNPKSGGGKVQSKSNRSLRKSNPYSVASKKANRNISTSETQLFMKMWKL